MDESSMAYKNIDAVMKEQDVLVGIIGKFKPMVVRMAGEEKKHWEKE